MERISMKFFFMNFNVYFCCMIESKRYSKAVLNWLLIGIIMVFFQVVIGGITRLTESGLSITKWEVVSGTLPPLSEAAWQNEFELYKQTPQYKEINEGMSFSEFKFIYFWEYVHRLWARFMGFVFLIPFLWFVAKNKLDRTILINLGIVVVFAILAATFGWIMVASGLIERPWVNAYKLSLHLMIAFAVYLALLWTYLRARYERPILDITSLNINRIFGIFIGIVFIQVFFGGVLSGMRAAVVYPTWPDMYGSYFPSIIFDMNQWNADNFNNYDRNAFMPALIHFLHRNTAYFLMIIGYWISFRMIKYGKNINRINLKNIGFALISVISLQALLGIITVLSSKNEIPVLWGVLHQGGALLLISVVMYIYFILNKSKSIV